MAKLSLYSKIERLKDFIKFFIEKYSPVCCFCKSKLSWTSFFPKISLSDRDDYTLHHKDHNRKNEKIGNKAISHRVCHRRHHREEQIFKEQNLGKKYSYIIYENIGGGIVKKRFRV